MTKRVYIDTSVVGGQFDKEFSADTIPFFEAVVNGRLSIIVSDLLEAELLRAPQQVRDFLATLPSNQIENIRLTPEAAQLADQYIVAKVVGQTSRADCQHIAMATLAKADVLVSWNFKHIVNLDKIRGYNGINYQLGHGMIEIRTPKEIINYDDANS
ncbi:type II toxin-antitoxin system VapC family toxin [Flavisolibacter ginsenosidimutans]|uniref:Type II toxin-antitoxin system VapC family toxin n=1 Tax=Flavisolibacter ginsenosidimutans TaxID=661481 RepID=A0A5B8UHC9_9BACT|nr:type II toxin-antitoxin system VapC family toxin [Flavisolibacter ginsenosidimutans]QEC56044.1 type II toxin-antitoxin system VapC family toxin [Flavisolibacter ginsenosidimutans]